MECPDPKTWADAAYTAALMLPSAIMICAAMWAFVKSGDR
jgi:hypothetical protein